MLRYSIVFRVNIFADLTVSFAVSLCYDLGGKGRLGSAKCGDIVGTWWLPLGPLWINAVHPSLRRLAAKFNQVIRTELLVVLHVVHNFLPLADTNLLSQT